MRVQATEQCFVQNRIRLAGEVFDHPDPTGYPYLKPVTGAPLMAPRVLSPQPFKAPSLPTVHDPAEAPADAPSDSGDDLLAE